MKTFGIFSVLAFLAATAFCATLKDPAYDKLSNAYEQAKAAEASAKTAFLEAKEALANAKDDDKNAAQETYVKASAEYKKTEESLKAAEKIWHEFSKPHTASKRNVEVDEELTMDDDPGNIGAKEEASKPTAESPAKSAATVFGAKNLFVFTSAAFVTMACSGLVK